MATDAPAAGDDSSASDPAADSQGDEDSESVAEPVDRSVAGTPESRYLSRIVTLEARVTALESELAERERDLQTVRDRYERLLDGPARYPGDPLDDFEPRHAERTDGGQRAGGDRDGVLDRLRRLYDRLR